MNTDLLLLFFTPTQQQTRKSRILQNIICIFGFSFYFYFDPLLVENIREPSDFKMAELRAYEALLAGAWYMLLPIYS